MNMKYNILSNLKFLYRVTILILLFSKAAYFLISLSLIESNSFILLILTLFIEYLPLNSNYLLNFNLYLYLLYFNWGKKVNSWIRGISSSPCKGRGPKLGGLWRVSPRVGFFGTFGTFGTFGRGNLLRTLGRLPTDHLLLRTLRTGGKIFNIFKFFIFIIILIVSIYNQINLISFFPVILSSNLDFNYLASFYNHISVGPLGLIFHQLTGQIPAPLSMEEGTFFGFDGRKESFPLGSEGGVKNFSVSHSLNGSDLNNNTSVPNSHSEINTSNYSSTSSDPLQEKEVTISSTPTSASSADSSPSATQIPSSPSSTPTEKILNNTGNPSDLLNISNFHSLDRAQKYDYIQAKFYQKGLDMNAPSLDWVIEKINKTDGTMTSVDNTINSNLNSILKIEREAKLNSHSFKRIRPFLLGRDHNKSPNQMPDTVPFKSTNDFED